MSQYQYLLCHSFSLQPSRYRHTPTCTVLTVQKVWRKLNFAQVRIQYTHGQLHMYIRGSLAEIQTPTHLNTIRQHNWPTICGITTFLSSHFPSHKDKYSTRFKHVIILIYFLLSLQCASLKLCKLGSVCTLVKLRQLVPHIILRPQLQMI